MYDLLTSNDRLLFNGGIAVLAVAPAVIGIFWGAPLVARELETGTYRLAWNQSVTRGRWLAAKLGFSVLATAVAVGHPHHWRSPGGRTRSTARPAASTAAWPRG